MIPAARQVLRSSRLGVVLALAALVVSLSIASPFFLTTNNVLNIGVAIALVGVVAAGSTLVMIAGGLDVSVGSTVALAGVSAANVLSSTHSVALAVVTGAVVGALAGLFNGLVITKLHINPLIATLGTLSVYRGLTFIVSDGVAIGVTEARFLDIGSGRFAGIPNPLIILLVVFGLLAVVLHGTDVGRNVYAIGGNPEAARLAGIDIKRQRLLLYVVSGLCCGIAAFMLIALSGSGQNTNGNLYELDAIAAAIIGGTLLSGGRGTITGSVLGVLVFTTITNLFALNNVQSAVQDIAKGAIIVAAVLIQHQTSRKSSTQ